MPNDPTWQAWTIDLDERRRAEILTEEEAWWCEQFPFLWKARAAQKAPGGAWRSWTFMGGRGAGKTRAGAEFINFGALFGHHGRAALVGPTFADVRDVMVEGISGLLACTPKGFERPRWEPTRRRLVWPNGAEAYGFSAEDPESLRGPQFDVAWCDEAAVWRQGPAVWNTLSMGLRLGDNPRAMVTTTPRFNRLIRRLSDGPGAVVTRSATRDNARHLAPGFVEAVEAEYGGTALGRQELMGELIEDVEGALWTREMVERAHGAVSAADCEEVVVAVDPAVSSGPRADACGIVAAGRMAGGRAAVLADVSVQGAAPDVWAGRVAALVEAVGAARVIAESNQGGEMVRAVLRTAGCDVPVRLEHARAGKQGRAGPAALLYQQGRVTHGPGLAALEDEMCRFGPALEGGGSPDRVDALVWALWALMIAPRRGGRVWGV